MLEFDQIVKAPLNVVYSFLATFITICLNDTAGLNAGIVGTLMMLSKFFDGVTDIFSVQ